MSSLRLRNALLRECMAEFLGTFVLLVSDTELIFCFSFCYYATRKLVFAQIYIVNSLL